MTEIKEFELLMEIKKILEDLAPSLSEDKKSDILYDISAKLNNYGFN